MAGKSFALVRYPLLCEQPVPGESERRSVATWLIVPLAQRLLQDNFRVGRHEAPEAVMGITVDRFMRQLQQACSDFSWYRVKRTENAVIALTLRYSAKQASKERTVIGG